MDPISIIGTARSVYGVIEVVAKTITAIRDLADEYKKADIRFAGLISQLIALRAAFDKISEWIKSDLVGDPYYQLVMDLDVSISCCRLVTSEIEAVIAELRKDEGGKLKVQSKVKLVFKRKNIDGLQKSLEQQTNALTLLLTACNW
jgi:guanine nucleotide-binding protein G(i) subunit alpha